MICTISGSAVVFKDNFNHSFDVILGYLSRGDVVVVIQTFNHDYRESFCVTRFGLGFVASKLIDYGDK